MQILDRLANFISGGKIAEAKGSRELVKDLALELSDRENKLATAKYMLTLIATDIERQKNPNATLKRQLKRARSTLESIQNEAS